MRMVSVVWPLLALVSLVVSPHAARADIRMDQRGAVAFLMSERLVPGDEATFLDFIDQPRSEPIRLIYLNSAGGSTQTAMAIGRMIRERHIDTAFHVGRGRCVSACTTVFIAGVHRYYIDSRSVPDGVATHLGLGFHPSNAGEMAESQVIDYYNRMGVPGAAEFRYRLYDRASVSEPIEGRNIHRQFFAGGESALQAGVATSLDEPQDAALRD